MRRMRGPAGAVSGATLVVALSLLGGCKTPGSYREPIALYQEGTAQARDALGLYYAEMNRYERDLYLDERLYDPGLDVLATDAAGQSTPLLGKRFSTESLQARMEAISLLGLYAERLAELAGAEHPGQLPEGAQVLGDRLGALGAELESLSQQGDASASKYVEPITSLVGVLGSIYLEGQQAAALQKGIEEGAPQVRAIIDLLEADMMDVLGPQRLTGLKQSLATRVMYYNLHKNEMSLAERRAVLEDISRAAEDYEALVAAHPVDVVRALRDAHEALVRFAEAERRVESFEELASAMQSFQGRAESAAAAVQRIHQSRRE